MRDLERANNYSANMIQANHPQRDKKISLVSFASSSSGNCTYVWNECTSLLLDCGLYPGLIRQHIKSMGSSINKLSGVLLTHVHTDHVNYSSLKVLLETGISVYCSEQVKEALLKKYTICRNPSNEKLIKAFRDNWFAINSLLIRGFEVPHDSEGGCYGFNIVFENGSTEKKISIATDLGFPESGLTEKFVDSDIIMIESNHDLNMLENSNRHYLLKKRIREVGHLSNVECAMFVIEILKNSAKLPEVIILAHLSQECNTNEIAESTLRKALSENNYGQVKVQMSFKDYINKIVVA